MISRVQACSRYGAITNLGWALQGLFCRVCHFLQPLDFLQPWHFVISSKLLPHKAVVKWMSFSTVFFFFFFCCTDWDGQWSHDTAVVCAAMSQGSNQINVDLSSAWSSDNHLRVISQEKPQPSITKINVKITYIKFYSNLPGANESTKLVHVCVIRRYPFVVIIHKPHIMYRQTSSIRYTSLGNKIVD